MSDPLLVVAAEPALAGNPAPAAQTDPAPAAALPGEPTPAQPAKPAWMAQLPKDLLDDADLSQFDKLDKLARTYKETRGKLSEAEDRLSKTTAIPGKDATPEQIDAFWKSMGRPDAPDGYQFDRSGDLSEIPKLPGLDEFTAELYHRLNLPKEVAETLWKENARKTKELMAEIKELRKQDAESGIKELEKLWGRDAPAKREELLQVAKKSMTPKDFAEFENSKLANSASFLDWMAGFKKYMSDSPIIAGSGAAGPQEPKTSEEALRSALGLNR